MVTFRVWSFHIKVFQDFHGGSMEWILPANAGGMDFIPGLGRCHMLWSYWVHVLHILSLCSRALKSWLLKPACSRAHEPQLESPCCNNWSPHVLQPARHNYWARKLQLPKPMHLELCNKRSHSIYIRFISKYTFKVYFLKYTWSFCILIVY